MRPAIDPDPDSSSDIAGRLAEQVVGQPAALQSIVPCIDMYRAGLAPEGRPAGVFLLLGPTGTGKTKTVEALASILHGDERHILRLDCGEFQMEHEVAKLIGAPPGYLGHRETQPMLNQQRLQEVTSSKSSLAIVLFDEIEKAAPSLTRLLLGVLDKAALRLGDNTTVSFENTLIFLTSNLGAREMMKEIQPDFGFQAAIGTENTDLRGKLENVASGAMRRLFSPEFVNRIDAVITYQPLDQVALGAIVDRQILELQRHVKTRLGERCFSVEVSPESREFLLHKGTSREYGARELKRTIHKHLTQPLATLVASSQIAPESVVRIEVSGDGKTLRLESTAGVIPAARDQNPVVLLVDDNRDLLRLFELALRRTSSWTILTATDGKEAETILRQQTPDVIVFDYLLPDANGVQMAVELRESHPGMEIVIATGANLFARDEASCQRHRFPVLRKPFLAEELSKLIRAGLSKDAAARVSSG